MPKKLIAKILLIAVMSSNFSTGVFASVNNNIINKDSTENLKIYRKTSLSPGEEVKKFNIPFHSNEPLGIEILEETEIEILIEGEGEDVYGSANVNLHDVDNLRGLQRVNVGEKTTVKIPRKGQLYLDVAGVKLKSDNPSEDFSFDVKLKLNGQDYEISPIFDIRENKISDKVILDPEEFKAKAFSDDNKEDSTILISENTRVHIPVSKYLPAHFDPQISAEAHEAVVTNFNKWSGLDENNANPLNRPRENFVLASARNEQGGFMSAGGTMLDTHTKNIYAYLGRPKLDDIWGMYHEYGHLYEQGWGFGEYWNNMFANALRRIDLDNPEWAWIYGNESSGYESNSLLPSYEKYLTTGETGKIHPMYFFLSFIDHMDSEFMAKLSTYWRENQLNYYGWDYVAYFIAKEYKLNVIPYIEATGELGYSVVNKDVIDKIMESSDRLFMYMPDDERFDEVRNLSIQPTIKSIYSGKNRVLKGMSNPNADIIVNVEGNEYKAKSNETGKFEVTITEDVRIDSNITITSKEEGKKVSFNKKVTVEDKNTSISFRGFKSEEFLSFDFDRENKKFKATSSGNIANEFCSGNYIKIDQYNKKGTLKNRFTVNANGNADEVAAKLNETSYTEGDYIKLYHQEQQGRLIINGEVLNAPYYLDTGVKNMNLNNTYFYILDGNLVYSENILDLEENRDDLISKVAEAKEIQAINYTSLSFENLQNAINNAETLINTTNVLEEEIILEIENLTHAIEELRKVNKIDFMGYKNETFLQLEFDNVNKKFVAKSNGKIIHPYQYSKEYAKVEHFNKKGEVKGLYSAFANKTANEMADGLNQANFIDGDYIKISHLEQNGRLKINGYVADAPQDLSQGALGLDLNKSYFYFEGESLRYTSTQLDLSADKSRLVSKIEEAKRITGDNYTKESYNNLLTAIAKGDELVNTPNLFEEEIAKEIEKIQNAIESLRELNKIIFKGYNNNEFLKISFDSEAKLLKAVSNGQAANPYIGGKYAEITHHDKKGNVKGRYSLNGGQTANELANQINNLEYVDGDFIKLYHAEKNHRLVIKGYVENSPYDLSTGAVNLDLNNSLFYLNGESLEYSIEQLDLSANKEALFTKIEEAKKLDGIKYTKISFENLQDVIANAEVLVNQSNLYEEEIVEEILKITKAIENLEEVNKIDFMGYDNEIFLSIEFDNINKRFVATSNGKMVHPYQYSREYAKIEHFDQKGNVKGEYKAIANKTADEMANSLNNATFVDGDYIKISHLEQNSRLRINGYVKDAPYDLSKGGYGLDLGNSYFYFDGENLRFSNSQLDLSADKSELISKVAEVKAIGGGNYTNGSYKMLKKAINTAELIVSQTNVYEDEISSEIIKLNEAVENLREVNVVEFKGFNNEVFMRLEFDSNNKRFIATSNGNTIHPYHYSREYARVEHYDKNGVLKGSFSAYANGTADEMANGLNNSSYEEGDYIKFYHLEQGNRLAIKGYINNFNGDITNEVGNLDLNNSKFNLDDESLTYIN